MNVQERIAKLSLEEKAALLQGWTTWTTLEIRHADIPQIFLADGPHGLRKQEGASDHLGLNASVPATCFPPAASMANTWNPELGEELGEALGKEAAAHDVHVVLGPGLNIKRSPLCGRNFEYFSEDPHLAGKMAAAYIRGIQKVGVAACPKHFAVNSQELKRMATDSILDERTLREIYLTGFEIAVKEGDAKSIMSSYNMVNGTYANENTHLITDILRGEWDFGGFVVTDWGADNDHTEGVRAGSNLVMPFPGADCAMQLVSDVRSGRIAESVLDARLTELLNVIVPLSENVKNADKAVDYEAHHKIARKCAEESIVLLDNDGILPLAADKTVAIIGDFAKSPRYQGAGSSQVNPTKLDNLYDCAVEAGMQIVSYAQGYDRKSPTPNEALIAEATVAAQNADVVLLCVGLEEILESEGMDRLHMQLSDSQQSLIAAVCGANKNIILVLSGGAPFEMPDRNSYRAAIHGYLSGQAGAAAMVDTLLGKICPSGRLNETWPHKLSDTPCNAYFPGVKKNCEYRESLFVGYRYYDTAEVPVRYPFGYGLSYTEFTYSDLKITEKGASFTVTNSGKYPGGEVAQLYVSCSNSCVYRPKKELKGFKKVFLAPGESTNVTIPFDDRTFRYFSTASNAWETEEGDYEIRIAANAQDVRLQATYHRCGIKASDNAPACYRKADIKAVSDADFRQLLGRAIPSERSGDQIYKNDAFSELSRAKSIPARLLGKLLQNLKDKADKKGTPDLNIMFVYNMPFRALSKLSMGLVTGKMADDMVFLVNGHFFRGLGRLICGFFKNLSATKKFKALLADREEKGAGL